MKLGRRLLLTQLRHRDPLVIETDRRGLFGCVGDIISAFGSHQS